MSVTVILADDHPIVRQGLRRLLEFDRDFNVIAEAGDGLETVQMAERHSPDVLVVDIMMPGLNGLEVTRQVVQRVPGIHVIILSMHQDDAYVLQALRCGALGYVLKESGPSELVQAIREVVNGRRYISQKINNRLIDYLVNHVDQSVTEDAYEKLSDREREVFQLIVEGNTSAEIARKLSLSTRTVETHRANMMRKLNISGQVELVRYAIKRGLLPADR